MAKTITTESHTLINVDPVRYSDEKLGDFKSVIVAKREKVLFDISIIVSVDRNENGTDDTSAKHQVEEDGQKTLSNEINHKAYKKGWDVKLACDRALIRLENKTYGVCTETGKLIPEERLRGNPLAVSCIEAKLAKKATELAYRTVSGNNLLKVPC